MHKLDPTTPQIVQNLPDPESVRDRLAHLFAEANLLRSLLRLSERAVRQRRVPADRREGDECRT